MGKQFSILQSLGSGGNAKVYLAWDITNSKQVAIKKMTDNNEHAVKMLNQEGELMSKVNHKYVLQVIRYGSDEFVDAKS